MQKVLVIQTAFLGDVLLTIPLLRNVSQLSPGVEITMVCRPGFQKLFVNELKLVRNVVEIKKGDAGSYRAAFKQLSSEKFDLLLCPHPSFRSALFARKISAEEKIGLGKWAFLYANKKIRWKKKHQAERLAAFFPEKNGAPKSSDVFSSGTLQTLKNDKTVTVFPGSQWGTKRWPAHHHRTLLRLLNDQGVQVFYLGSAEDSAIVDKITKENGPGFFKNFCGKLSLLQTIATAASTPVTIANDSGGGHLASLTGSRVLSIYGPTVPGQGFTPWTANGEVIQVSNLNCRPCSAHGPNKCPLHHHACMEEIEPRAVFEKLMNILEK